ncbi:MAG: hypothetical protein PHW25_17520 [Zoogloea sp.]|uniref:hypothetical protein n=1 Tax=Zoogloea sp. TaxID=49181 RepID=UPI002608565D|nr:hypothetical protein [Zoogloea sp.]MDD3328884.1 hypothetical protein [Zoogloea sp.]
MAGDTQVALLVNADTGEHCVGIAHAMDDGRRVLQARFDALTGRAIASDLIRFADDCDTANARADAVAAQLLEKFMHQEDEA